MSNAIYKKDLHDVALAVAQGSKDYTDKTKEEIYWHIGDYSISTQADNTTASTKTVPSGATRCKIKKIYGLTEKFNPTVAYDNASTMTKTMPNIVYDFDCSIVYGNSEVSENKIILTNVSQQTRAGVTFTPNSTDGSVKLNGTATNNQYFCFSTIYQNENGFPNGLKAGDTIGYRLFGNAMECMLTIYARVNNSWIQIVDYGFASSVEIPSDATGLIIRVSAKNETTYNNKIVYPMIVAGSTAPTEFKVGFDGIHNLELSGLKVYDSDNVEQVSKTIDLSTILYNENPLFEGNSLKKVDTAIDYLMPYKAHKEVGALVVDSNARYTWIRPDLTAATIMPTLLAKKSSNVVMIYVSNNTNIDRITGEASGGIYIVFKTAYSSQNELKNAMLGTIIEYPLDTPIEVSIDWSSTLRGITGYSNGTITLQNTHNMDTANTITYNSIIKENCCAKIVQSRGGNVVKTINLPTTASDGYSAGSVNNVRDFTTNKRGTNANKNDNLGGLTYTKYDVAEGTLFRATLSSMKYDNTTNLLCAKYDVVLSANRANMTISKAQTGAATIDIIDNSYNDTTTFKTAMTNEPLYYELKDSLKTESDIDSVDNIIEVQPNDVLSFYDSNDNLVTVPSDLTYRIEVERV